MEYLIGFSIAAASHLRFAMQHNQAYETLVLLKPTGHMTMDKSKQQLIELGHRIYMGTVEIDGSTSKPLVCGPEPGFEIDYEPGPDKGFVQHGNCGAYTIVLMSNLKSRNPGVYTCFGCNQYVTYENVVELEPDPSQFELFGDESTAGPYVLYGLLTLNVQDWEKAEQRIKEILDSSFGPEGRFHCKILFNGDQRKKTRYSAFNTDFLWDVALKLITELKKYRPAFTLGVAHRNTYPDSLPGNRKVIKIENEHLYPTAFSAALAPLQASGILDSDTRLRIDQLKTKLDFWGMGGHQVQQLLNDQRIKIEICSEVKPVLLDVVDIFLYAAGRVLRQKTNRTLAQEICNLCQPQVSDVRWEPNREDSPKKPVWLDGFPVKDTQS
jgi:hypothetical protein